MAKKKIEIERNTCCYDETGILTIRELKELKEVERVESWLEANRVKRVETFENRRFSNGLQNSKNFVKDIKLLEKIR